MMTNEFLAQLFAVLAAFGAALAAAAAAFAAAGVACWGIAARSGSFPPCRAFLSFSSGC